MPAAALRCLQAPGSSARSLSAQNMRILPCFLQWPFPPPERRIAFYLKQGLSFPAARARAYTEIAPDAGNAEAFASPNNILAIEYLRALASIAPDISPIAVPRTGAAHDAPCASAKTGFASASALREAAERCDMLLLRNAAPAQVAAEIEAAVMALHAAFLAAVKTKRYTLARLRRIAMHALLGVDKAFVARHPAPRYLRVLGVRRDALALLSALSECASLPVVSGYQDYAALNGIAKEQFDLDLFAGELSSMAAPAPEAASSEFSRPLLIV